MTIRTEFDAVSLKTYFESSGQDFTMIVKRWARAYVPLVGGTVSISGQTNLKDGGIDGYITFPNTWECPFGFTLSENCVLQLKAGDFTKSVAKAELTREAAPGEYRIRNDIENGKQILWFAGKALADADLSIADNDLNEIIDTINPGSPRGLVIDLNRLAELLSVTPVVAIEHFHPTLGCVTSETELYSNRHRDLPNFARPPGQADFEKELVLIAQSSEVGRRVTYRYGAPGTGKTRRVLEAVVKTPQLSGTTLYFKNPKDARAFLRFAEQHRMSAFIIVDDYLDDTDDEARIGLEDVPNNVRCLLIGHGQTIRSAHLKDLAFEPLEEEGLFRVLKEQYPTLTDGAIRHHMKEAGQNIRLANIFCSELGNNLDIVNIVNLLQRIWKDKCNIRDMDVFICLSLVKFLKSNQRSAYCELSGVDEDRFEDECRVSSQSNMLIQHNEHVSYISCNKLAYLMLIETWIQARQIIQPIIEAPGDFRGQILERLKELPECDEKSEMLAFFKPAIGDLTLSSMANGMGSEFVQLMLATPEEYLPILVKCILDEGEGIKEWFYEGERFGRRELIGPLTDLAQFSRYFEQCEAVIFQLVKYEVETAYANDAKAVWCNWFRPYFDYTVYPYPERLSLLERRIQDDPRSVIPLLSKIVADLFPLVGMFVPSKAVGGRPAPATLHDSKFYPAQCQVAVELYPRILQLALHYATDFEREKLCESFAKGALRWISFTGDTDGVLAVLESRHFTDDARLATLYSLRSVWDLRDFRSKGKAEQGRGQVEESVYYERINKVIQRLSRSDDVEELSYMLQDDFVFHRNEDLSSSAVKLGRRITRDEALFARALPVLSDNKHTGGVALAKLLQPLFSDGQSDSLLQALVKSEGNQFLYAFVFERASVNKSFREAAVKAALSVTESNWVVALNLLDQLDRPKSYHLRCNLILKGILPVTVLGRLYLRDENDASAELWELIDLVRSQVQAGNEDSVMPCLHICSELIRIGRFDERAVELATDTLKAPAVSWRTVSDYSWKAVADRLASLKPQVAIEIASRSELDQFSKAVELLTELVPEHGSLILANLEERISRPNDQPFLLIGALEPVFRAIDDEMFSEWLLKQSDAVLLNVAGHLPRPEMVNGSPHLHTNTLAYWRQVGRVSPVYTGASKLFLANARSFGWTGDGIDFFSEHVALARGLLTHELDGIRDWAASFKALAERDLQEAREMKAVDQARERTRD